MNLQVCLLLLLLLKQISGRLTDYRNAFVNLQSTSRLVGGYDAMPNAYPFLVSLQTRILWIRVHMCGGALLNEKWILTAGHCVVESWLIRWLPMDAVVGTHDVERFGSNAQISTITDRVPHPLYDGGIGEYDIAMLKVSTPFTMNKFVQPIRLPTTPKINKQLKLTGWGVLKSTFFIPVLPEQLQEANVTLLPFKDCYKAIDKLKEENEKNPLIEESNICTMDNRVSACNGDSGGPLVQYVPITENIDQDRIQEMTEEYYDDFNSIDETTSIIIEEPNKENDDDIEKVPEVVGVVSWGIYPCGTKGAPSVYTKVTSYIDFINYTLTT